MEFFLITYKLYLSNDNTNMTLNNLKICKVHGNTFISYLTSFIVYRRTHAHIFISKPSWQNKEDVSLLLFLKKAYAVSF